MNSKETLENLQFYAKNEKGEQKINSELYDVVAQTIASNLVGRNNNKLNGVSRHQLRGLFDETKRIKRRLEQKNIQWNDVEPAVRLLKSKTSYAVERAKKNGNPRFDGPYYDYLKDFIHKGIDMTKNEEDFDVFCNLFEAVYGFYYEKGGAQTS